MSAGNPNDSAARVAMRPAGDAAADRAMPSAPWDRVAFTAGATAQPPQAESVLEAKDVAFSYARNRCVLDGVSAQLVPGVFLAVIGKNGSGKSTLLNCLDAVLRPDRGSVLLDGDDLLAMPGNRRAQRIAYVAQHSHASRTSVYDALLLGRKPVLAGAPREDDYAAVDRVLADMGLEELALCSVDELSGGEYQKVVLARAFVQDTDVLLLDEPTNNLDISNQHEVMRLVRAAVHGEGARAGAHEGARAYEGAESGAGRARRIAAAAVLHDINLALAYCDRFVALAQGRVVASGGPEVITPALLREVYGVDAQILTHGGRRIVVIG